jgi:hypothetical protein
MERGVPRMVLEKQGMKKMRVKSKLRSAASRGVKVCGIKSRCPDRGFG